MAMTQADMAIAIVDLKSQDLRASEKIDRLTVSVDDIHTMVKDLTARVDANIARSNGNGELLANINRVVIASKMIGSVLKVLVYATIAMSAFVGALASLKIYIPFFGKL